MHKLPFPWGSRAVLLSCAAQLSRTPCWTQVSPCPPYVTFHLPFSCSPCVYTPHPQKCSSYFPGWQRAQRIVPCICWLLENRKCSFLSAAGLCLLSCSPAGFWFCLICPGQTGSTSRGMQKEQPGDGWGGFIPAHISPCKPQPTLCWLVFF